MEPMQEVTMDLLTDEEKKVIENAPDKIISFLFNNILEKGALPQFFDIIFVPTDDTGRETVSTRFEGAKVLAALAYVDHLVDTGKRTDPYE